MKTKIMIAVAALVLMTASLAQAGWIIHEDGMGGNKMVIYIQKNMIYNDSEAMSSLIDLDKGWIYMINKARKIYWGGPLDAFEEEMMAAIDKQIDEQMKDMPADQRKAMKERMKDGMSGAAGAAKDIEVVKTGKSEQVAGRICDQYAIKTEGQVSEEHWIATSIKIGKEIDLKKMQEQMAKLKMGSGPGGLASAEPVLALWEKGYPLKKVYFMMGQKMVSQAVKVEQKSIPAKTFKIPSSFKKSEVMAVMAQQ